MHGHVKEHLRQKSYTLPPPLPLPLRFLSTIDLPYYVENGRIRAHDQGKQECSKINGTHETTMCRMAMLRCVHIVFWYQKALASCIFFLVFNAS